MAVDSKNLMNTLFGVSFTLIPHPSCVDPNEAPADYSDNLTFDVNCQKFNKMLGKFTPFKPFL